MRRTLKENYLGANPDVERTIDGGVRGSNPVKCRREISLLGCWSSAESRRDYWKAVV
ncbi:hypothetical protein CEB3_c12860 [Peptococcaceae bacterium CEB3]|nr:hypothetical protein CEB3_c12860 [Peptococcaceae bacterium CEB3]